MHCTFCSSAGGDESDESFMVPKQTKPRMKKAGKKSRWPVKIVDDLVDLHTMN